MIFLFFSAQHSFLLKVLCRLLVIHPLYVYKCASSPFLWAAWECQRRGDPESWHCVQDPARCRAAAGTNELIGSTDRLQEKREREAQKLFVCSLSKSLQAAAGGILLTGAIVRG